MSIDLADYDTKARKAIRAFWRKRKKAKQKQIQSGKGDQGERAGVGRRTTLPQGFTGSRT